MMDVVMGNSEVQREGVLEYHSSTDGGSGSDVVTLLPWVNR